MPGLHDRSSRPRRSPRRTPAELEARVLQVRRAQRRGQDWIGAELGISPRTVSAILARHHVPRLADCDPRCIPDGGGWRAERGTLANHASRIDKIPIGYDYVHSLIDDHSRFAYSEILPDEKGATCAVFLQRAAANFAAHGIDHIERVMTDNAWAYRYSLGAAVDQLGAKQVFIRPHCPWQNGKVERLNRTLQSEWAYRRPFNSNAERAAALAPWLEHYNNRRRHSALGGRPPISRLSPM
jgi:transposase InsO family protein